MVTRVTLDWPALFIPLYPLGRQDHAGDGIGSLNHLRLRSPDDFLFVLSVTTEEMSCILVCFRDF